MTNVVLDTLLAIMRVALIAGFAVIAALWIWVLTDGSRVHRWWRRTRLYRWLNVPIEDT